MAAVFDFRQAMQNFPGHSQQLARLEEKASKLRRSCGCATGAIFFLASLFVLLFSVVHEPPGWHGVLHLLAWLAKGFVVLLLATVAGKAVGLGVARMRLVMLNHYLHRTFSSDESMHAQP